MAYEGIKETEARQGQVFEQIEQMERSIGHLGEVVGCIEGRLKPILREQDEDENKPDAPQLVPLAETVNTLAAHVRRQTERLTRILERLEL